MGSLIRDTRCPFCTGEYTGAQLTGRRSDGNLSGHDRSDGARWQHDRGCLLSPRRNLPAWAALTPQPHA